MNKKPTFDLRERINSTLSFNSAPAVRMQEGGKIKTFSNDPEYFNSQTFDKWTIKQLRTGKYGVDPKTRALYKLKTPVKVPQEWLDLTSENPSGTETARRGAALSSLRTAYQNPVMQAPGMIGLGAGAGAALKAAAPGAMQLLNAPMQIGSKVFPAVTPANILTASQLAAVPQNVASGVSNIRQGNYLQGAADLGTAALDVAVPEALNVAKPLTTAGQIANKYRKAAPYLIKNTTSDIKSFIKTPTKKDFKNKLERLKKIQDIFGSTDEGRKAFNSVKSKSFEFWNTPEGERRIKKYIDDLDLAKQGVTIDDFKDAMSKIEYIDRGSQKNIEQKFFSLMRDRNNTQPEIFSLVQKEDELLKKLGDGMKAWENARAEGKAFNAQKYVFDVKNQLVSVRDDLSKVRSRLDSLIDETAKLPSIRQDNASYFPLEQKIYIGGSYSNPMDAVPTAFHEWGHGKSGSLLYNLYNKGDKNLKEAVRQPLFAKEERPLNYRLKEKFNQLGTSFDNMSVLPNILLKSQPHLMNPIPKNISKNFRNLKNPVSNEAINRFLSPTSSVEDAYRYFKTGDEPSGFIGEVLGNLIENNFIKSQSEKIDVDMLKNAIKNYRENPNIKTPVRFFDFINPTDKSLKDLADELNDLTSQYDKQQSSDDQLILSAKQGGVVSRLQQKMGYKDNSPYKNLPYQDIYSDRITMSGVSRPLVATTDTGVRTVMQPGGEYYFPGATQVRETPLYSNGGGTKDRENLQTMKLNTYTTPLSKLTGISTPKFQNSGNTSSNNQSGTIDDYKPQNENQMWIKAMIGFEKKRGAPGGKPHTRYGINDENKYGKGSPTSLGDAVQRAEKYLISENQINEKDAYGNVKGIDLNKLPLKIRQRVGDYRFNSGRNARHLLLYAAGLIELDDINDLTPALKKARIDAREGRITQAQLDEQLKKHSDRLDKLWKENEAEVFKRINNNTNDFADKIDTARDDIFRTTKATYDSNYNIIKSNPDYTGTVAEPGRRIVTKEDVYGNKRRVIIDANDREIGEAVTGAWSDRVKMWKVYDKIRETYENPDEVVSDLNLINVIVDKPNYRDVEGAVSSVASQKNSKRIPLSKRNAAQNTEAQNQNQNQPRFNVTNPGSDRVEQLKKEKEQLLKQVDENLGLNAQKANDARLKLYDVNRELNRLTSGQERAVKIGGKDYTVGIAPDGTNYVFDGKNYYQLEKTFGITSAKEADLDFLVKEGLRSNIQIPNPLDKYDRENPGQAPFKPTQVTGSTGEQVVQPPVSTQVQGQGQGNQVNQQGAQQGPAQGPQTGVQQGTAGVQGGAGNQGGVGSTGSQGGTGSQVNQGQPVAVNPPAATNQTPPTFRMSGVAPSENTKNVTLYQTKNGVSVVRDSKGNVFLEKDGVASAAIDNPELFGKWGDVSKYSNQQIIDALNSKGGDSFIESTYQKEKGYQINLAPYGKSLVKGVNNQGIIDLPQQGGETRYKYRYDTTVPDHRAYSVFDTRNPDKGWTKVDPDSEAYNSIYDRYQDYVDNIASEGMFKVAKGAAQSPSSAADQKDGGDYINVQSKDRAWDYRYNTQTNQWEVKRKKENTWIKVDDTTEAKRKAKPAIEAAYGQDLQAELDKRKKAAADKKAAEDAAKAGGGTGTGTGGAETEGPTTDVTKTDGTTTTTGGGQGKYFSPDRFYTSPEQPKSAWWNRPTTETSWSRLFEQQPKNQQATQVQTKGVNTIPTTKKGAVSTGMQSNSTNSPSVETDMEGMEKTPMQRNIDKFLEERATAEKSKANIQEIQRKRQALEQLGLPPEFTNTDNTVVPNNTVQKDSQQPVRDYYGPPYVNGGKVFRAEQGMAMPSFGSYDPGQDILGGAKSGMQLGSQLGSFVPGIGQGVGALVGATIGGIEGGIMGAQNRAIQRSDVIKQRNLIKQQQDVANRGKLFGMLTNMLGTQQLPGIFQEGAQVQAPIYTNETPPQVYSTGLNREQLQTPGVKPTLLDMDPLKREKTTGSSQSAAETQAGTGQRIITIKDEDGTPKRVLIDSAGNVIRFIDQPMSEQQKLDLSYSQGIDYAISARNYVEQERQRRAQAAAAQNQNPVQQQQGGPIITSLLYRNMDKNNSIKNNISMNKSKLESVINLSNKVNPYRLSPMGVYKNGGLIMEGGVSASRAGFSRQPITGASSTGPLGPKRSEVPSYTNKGVNSIMDLPTNEYVPTENMIPIQAEIGEMIVLPTGDLMPVMARRRHHQMQDDEVTDMTPENSYILSAHGQVRINKDEANLLITETGVKPYRLGQSQNPPTEKTLASVMTKKVMRPAEVAKRINSLFPVLSTDNPFEIAANIENKINRKPYLEGLIQLSELDKYRKGLSEPAMSDLEQQQMQMPQRMPGSPMLARQGRRISRPGVVKAQNNLDLGNFAQNNNYIWRPTVDQQALFPPFPNQYPDSTVQNAYTLAELQQLAGSSVVAPRTDPYQVTPAQGDPYGMATSTRTAPPQQNQNGIFSALSAPANFAARLIGSQAMRNAERAGIRRERGIYDQGLGRMGNLMTAGTAAEAAMLGAQDPFVKWRDIPDTYIRSMRTQTPGQVVEAQSAAAFANLPQYGEMGQAGLAAQNAAYARGLEQSSRAMMDAAEKDRAAFNTQQALLQENLAGNVAGRLAAERATTAAINKMLSGYGSLANRYAQGQIDLTGQRMGANIGLSRAEQASKTGLYQNRLNAFTTFTGDMTAGGEAALKALLGFGG